MRSGLVPGSTDGTFSPLLARAHTNPSQLLRSVAGHTGESPRSLFEVMTARSVPGRLVSGWGPHIRVLRSHKSNLARLPHSSTLAPDGLLTLHPSRRPVPCRLRLRCRIIHCSDSRIIRCRVGPLV